MKHYLVILISLFASAAFAVDLDTHAITRGTSAVPGLSVAVNGKTFVISGTPTLISGTIPASQVSGLPMALPAVGGTAVTITGTIPATQVSGLATVATTGNYSSLLGLPTIPTNTNQLTNGAGYITATGTAATITGTIPLNQVAGAFSSAGGTITGNVVVNGLLRAPNQTAEYGDYMMTRDLFDKRFGDFELRSRSIVFSECQFTGANGGTSSANQYGSGNMSLNTGTTSGGCRVVQFSNYVNRSVSTGAGMDWGIPWRIVFRSTGFSAVSALTADTNFYFRMYNSAGGWPVVVPPWTLDTTGIELRFSGNGAGAATIQLNVYRSGTLTLGTPYSGGVYAPGGPTYYELKSDGTTITASYRRAGTWVVIGSAPSPAGAQPANVIAAVQNSGTNAGTALSITLDMVKIIDLQ